MKKSIYKTTLLFFICGCIFLILLVINKKTNQNTEQDKTEHEFDPYTTSIEINKLMTGEFAPDIVCETDKEEKITLNELAVKNPILIFRYADVNCNTCYVSELAILNESFSESLKHVNILCSYYSPRDYSVFKKMNKIKFPMYRIPHEAFDWEMEYYGAPYFFVLHPDLSISNIYIPDKAYPELSRKYLNKVKELLSEKI